MDAPPSSLRPAASDPPAASTVRRAMSSPSPVLPPGGVMLASSAQCKHQAFRVGLSTYAFQYHFEWTRSDIAGVLEQFADWISQSGSDARIAIACV